MTVDEKLNRILDEVMESGLFRSKAQLFRFCLRFYFTHIGLIEDKMKKNTKAPLKP